MPKGRTANSPIAVLLIEGSPQIETDMAQFLADTNGAYELQVVHSLNDALTAVRKKQPTVVIFNIATIAGDTSDLVKQMRNATSAFVYIATEHSDSNTILQGLEAGADDYVIKPFEPQVLLARIKARLRPPISIGSELVTIGPLTLDIEGHEVRRGNDQVQLTPLEFNLLLTLAQKPKQVFTREMLLESVWGYHYKADTRLVNVHIQRLRSKIEDDPDNPKIIATVRGVGYKAGQA